MPLVHYLLRKLCRKSFFEKWAIPASFSFCFSLFQANTNTILQQINVKNVHPVYGTGIRTHDLQYMSLLPLPLARAANRVLLCCFSATTHRYKIVPLDALLICLLM